MLTNSEAESIAYFKSRKRTHLRGVIAGLVGFFLISTVVLLTAIAVQGVFSLFFPEGHALAKFIASSTAQTGSLLISTSGLFTAIFNGAFIAMWAPKGSRIVIGCFVVMTLANVVVFPIPDGLTTTQLLFWVLAGPVGYQLGWELYFWREHKTSSAQYSSKN